MNITTCRDLAPVQIGIICDDAGSSEPTQHHKQKMTRDTVSIMVGDLQHRNRTNSLAAPVFCDLYRRSLSEGPEEVPAWSARHEVKRSHSVKVRKSRPPPEIETALPRWYCYRVRSFHMSSRGVINRGDSLRYRQARRKDQLPSRDEKGQENDAEKFCVQILGASGVGKTALGNQFLTSEHIFVRSNLPVIIITYDIRYDIL
uniref:Uncharacterized protein n=1 Tax=Strigamia maritima TaxID=126957 RepID=T1JFJ6_STRMM